jgi:hypothetical protein
MKMFVVSIEGTPGAGACGRPAAAQLTVRKNLQGACTPSPDTSRVIDELSALRDLVDLVDLESRSRPS